MDRKAMAESLRGRESRQFPTGGLELREANGSLGLSGWASVTNRAYDMGMFKETIKRGAFAKTLSETPDVQLLLNHEGLPLARTVSGTLRLSEDDQGLKVDADLNPDDPDVQRLAPKVERGDISGMSFGFRVTRQNWDDDYENREIAEVNLDRGDVSVVNQGANPHASFSLRDATELLKGMSRDEFVEFMRSICPEALEPAPPSPDESGELAPGLDLSLAKARALALRLRGRSLTLTP